MDKRRPHYPIREVQKYIAYIKITMRDGAVVIQFKEK